MSVPGIVINVHQLGATVRLEDGTIASIPSAELAAHRPTFVRSLQRREALPLDIVTGGRRASVRLAGPDVPPENPPLYDAAFEARMTAYLKSVEERLPQDGPAPAERHFIRKKRRAALFEARSKT